MSWKGNCWDNAVAESFFSSLKKERINKQIYKNRALAIADVSDYIDTFYNRTRRHSHLAGLSPEQVEAVHKAEPRGSPLNPGNSIVRFLWLDSEVVRSIALHPDLLRSAALSRGRPPGSRWRPR